MRLKRHINLPKTSRFQLSYHSSSSFTNIFTPSSNFLIMKFNLAVLTGAVLACTISVSARWLQTSATQNYWEYCRSDGGRYNTLHVCFQAPSDSFARQLAGQGGWSGYLGSDPNHFVVFYDNANGVTLTGNEYIVDITFLVVEPPTARDDKCALVTVTHSKTHAVISSQNVCKGQMMTLPA
ncbi:hypothetical protein PSEUBRA_003982 [Kalmanozyma brasiliensis GHG001]|uniref:uncharacterized protein n=1 Tax=Kalmanozyma brasiliensis (strain GHG001) TaxID=1365824 RepID=UPI002867DE9D|nr:uncharacterized protein PSEUBRA_003982 [Kalmanozyma brasiliensis GHG001]KAF6767321.1 hypothetical protein PSEUBRA_003982 [Kalmanozyma brasiliensis GHG001]